MLHRNRGFGTWLSAAVLIGGGAAVFGCGGASDDAEKAAEAARQASAACLADVGELCDRRIAPLLSAERPKSCNQCHLSGIDLGAFVRDSICGTRACLLERGLVDTEDPDDSVILQWIARAEPESELVTEAVIAEEYEGFSEFLHAISECGGESCAGVTCNGESAPGACSSTEPSVNSPRLVPEDTGCDPISIEQAFIDTAYAERGRCFPCHFTTEPLADRRAPRWIETRGGCEVGAATTLRQAIDSRYLDLDDPARSLLLQKPLDPAAGGIGDEHGGGVKFHSETDLEYQTWLGFIEYLASCR
jgi:hypothetical protein